MSSIMKRSYYEKMIAENLKWLSNQPDSLEKTHIEQIIKRSADHEYGELKQLPPEHEKVLVSNLDNLYDE